jgi:hypothetical protein
MMPAPMKLRAVVVIQSLGVARIQPTPSAQAASVAYLPVAATSAITPRGVTFVPVAGVPPGEVVLAWDAHQPPRHISDLLTAARMER